MKLPPFYEMRENLINFDNAKDEEDVELFKLEMVILDIKCKKVTAKECGNQQNILQQKNTSSLRTF